MLVFLECSYTVPLPRHLESGRFGSNLIPESEVHVVKNMRLRWMGLQLSVQGKPTLTQVFTVCRGTFLRPFTDGINAGAFAELCLASSGGQGTPTHECETHRSEPLWPQEIKHTVYKAAPEQRSTFAWQVLKDPERRSRIIRLRTRKRAP